jgi:hypothetical protein
VDLSPLRRPVGDRLGGWLTVSHTGQPGTRVLKGGKPCCFEKESTLTLTFPLRNAPQHEYTARPAHPVAATNVMRSLATASDGAGGFTATTHCGSSSKRKAPAPLVQPPPPSRSPPPFTKSSAPPPAKVTGKRGSSSQGPVSVDL